MYHNTNSFQTSPSRSSTDNDDHLNHVTCPHEEKNNLESEAQDAGVEPSDAKRRNHAAAVPNNNPSHHDEENSTTTTATTTTTTAQDSTETSTTTIATAAATSTSIRNFEIIKSKLLGKGSFGSVYLGRNRITDDLVAVKVINKKEMVDKIGLKLTNKYLKSEVDSMTRVNHENVLRLLGKTSSGSECKLVLEKCDIGFDGYLTHKTKLYEKKYGSIYAKKTRRKPILSEPEIRYWLYQLFSGLHCLHTHQLIHRDIKPGNLLLMIIKTKEHTDSWERFVLKIADFGLSKYLAEDTLTNTVVGSKPFMSPEVSTHKPYTKSADMWSVGCVLHMCISGKLSWDHSMSLRKYLDRQFELSEELKDLTCQLLQKDPNERIDCAAALSHSFFNAGKFENTRIVESDTIGETSPDSENHERVGFVHYEPPHLEIINTPAPPTTDTINKDAAEDDEIMNYNYEEVYNGMIMLNKRTIHMYRNQETVTVTFPSLAPNRTYLISIHNDVSSFDDDMVCDIQLNGSDGARSLWKGEISRGTHVQQSFIELTDVEIQVTCYHSYPSYLPYSLFGLGITGHIQLHSSK